MNQPTYESAKTTSPQRRTQTLWDAPIFDSGPNKYRRRVGTLLAIGSVALLSGLGAKQAVQFGSQEIGDASAAVGNSLAANDDHLPKPDLSKLPKTFIDEGKDTVWSIASAEGPAVANNPETLYQAMNSIDAQLPGDNPHNLQPGDPIRLPANSAIGTVEHAIPNQK